MKILISKTMASSGWMRSLLMALVAAFLISNAEAQRPQKVTTVVLLKPQVQHKNANGSGGEIFNEVEHSAEFPGGVNKFYDFLAKNMRYPAKARENKVQGKVFLTFIVEKNGSLSDIKVVRGIGSGCDEEAVRVIKSSPKWKPGTQNGHIVRQQYTVPIMFSLSKTGHNK